MSIIFKQMEAVKSGRKTQTRRVVKAGEGFAKSKGYINKILLTPTELVGIVPPDGYLAAVYFANGRRKWMAGNEYACVPKMYQPAFGRIRITGIRCERLHDITEADAIAEGVDSVAEYRELWQSINGKTKGARWDDNPWVWVLSFEYVGDVVR